LHVNIVCFQETKLDVIDDFTVLQSLGPSFDEYMYLPAVQTRGGILLAWDTSVIELENFSFDTYAIMAEVKTRDNNRWWISTVYGPQDTADKINFLREISERRALCPGPWMIIGDFNMILYASEKNNENLDRRMMARFRRFVQEQELKDLYMHGRVYTWSNEREIPTMTRIDRALVSVDWDLQNPDALLQAMSSSISDHAPLHLSLSAAFRPKQRFKFELFWLNLEGIDEAIKEAWKCDDRITEPFRRLDALFRNAAVLGTEENWERQAKNRHPQHGDFSVGGGTGEHGSIARGEMAAEHIETCSAWACLFRKNHCTTKIPD
jgi:exonuclease III